MHYDKILLGKKGWLKIFTDASILSITHPVINPVWYDPSVMNIRYGGGAKTPALHNTDIYQSV